MFRQHFRRQDEFYSRQYFHVLYFYQSRKILFFPISRSSPVSKFTLFCCFPQFPCFLNFVAFSPRMLLFCALNSVAFSIPLFSRNASSLNFPVSLSRSIQLSFSRQLSRTFFPLSRTFSYFLTFLLSYFATSKLHETNFGSLNMLTFRLIVCTDPCHPPPPNRSILLVSSFSPVSSHCFHCLLFPSLYIPSCFLLFSFFKFDGGGYRKQKRG